MPTRGVTLEDLQVARKNRYFADAEPWGGSFLTDEVLFRAFGASASTSELPLHRPR